MRQIFLHRDRLLIKNTVITCRTEQLYNRKQQQHSRQQQQHILQQQQQQKVNNNKPSHSDEQWIATSAPRC